MVWRTALRIALIAMSISLLASYAHSETLQMECGPSEGYVYNSPEGLVGTSESGWTSDKISNGLSVFELDLNTGKVTYRWRDARNTWFDANVEGAELRLLSIDESDFSWQLIAIFGEVTEVCTFVEVLEEQPKALCATSKNTAFGSSARALVANCTATIIPDS